LGTPLEKKEAGRSSSFRPRRDKVGAGLHHRRQGTGINDANGANKGKKGIGGDVFFKPKRRKKGWPRGGIRKNIVVEEKRLLPGSRRLAGKKQRTVASFYRRMGGLHNDYLRTWAEGIKKKNLSAS